MKVITSEFFENESEANHKMLQLHKEDFITIVPRSGLYWVIYWKEQVPNVDEGDV